MQYGVLKEGERSECQVIEKGMGSAGHGGWLMRFIMIGS